MMNTDLVLPEFVGGRASADAFADSLPVNLTDYEVTVDATRVVSVARCFADEFILQILVIREAGSLAVGGATPRFAKYLIDAAAVRNLEDRLVVQCDRLA